MKPFNLKKVLKEQTEVRRLQEQQNNPEAEARLRSEHVNYFGPEKGPFKCGHCKFFNADKNYCLHPEVLAHVEAEGCCNEYKPIEGE